MHCFSKEKKKMFSQKKKKKKKFSKRRIVCFSTKMFFFFFFKEMFACFSRRGFQVWIQMRKDLRCVNNIIGLKEKQLS
jgi:hypothetical protein